MTTGGAPGPARAGLSVDGTRLRLDGSPFRFRGLSFFNALFNASFNRDDQARRAWLSTFRRNGVTALRAWCQWDFQPPHLFADVGPGQSLFQPSGALADPFANRLVALADAAAELGMVLEVTLFPRNVVPTWTATPWPRELSTSPVCWCRTATCYCKYGTSMPRRPNGFTTSSRTPTPSGWSPAARGSPTTWAASATTAYWTS